MHVVAGRGDGFREQMPRGVGAALAEQLAARLEHLFGSALPLGERRAGAIDIGPGAGMAAVEKQDARPEMDRVFVRLLK